VTGPTSEERLVGVGELGERLSSLRLCEPKAVASMQCSLKRHGQLSALVACAPAAGGLEVIDGFKRLRAARALGLDELRVTVSAIDLITAKVAIGALHEGLGLTELEEGWLVRSLYREDRLSQPQIGVLLGRHKSWVNRRLLLVEVLDETVQADVRLGLLSASAATQVGQLQRCNQRALSTVVTRTGLTTRQTATLVAELLACPTVEAQAARIAAQEKSPSPARAPPRPVRRARTDAEWILGDVGVLRQRAAQLQARLCARPLRAHGQRGAELLSAALCALTPVLGVLAATITESIAKGPSNGLEHARGVAAPSGHAACAGPLPARDCASALGESQHGP
jgi:ParB-like chromosome segregation protein Spo0J